MKYQLNITGEIIQCDDYGHPNYGYGNLQIKETTGFEALTFGEIAGVLARFHDLSDAIKAIQHGEAA